MVFGPVPAVGWLRGGWLVGWLWLVVGGGRLGLQGLGRRWLGARLVFGLGPAFVKFTWNPNRHSRPLQGMFWVQVEPKWAHLHPFRQLTT